MTALGVVTSPIYMEVRLGNDRVELIETHNRYGGSNIVELLQLSGITRPFRSYFEPCSTGVPTPAPPNGTGG